MLQPIEPQQNETQARAKEIHHGTVSLPMENVILGLATKPGPRIDDQKSVSVRKWSYEDIVAQEKLIGTFEITPDTKAGEVVWNFIHNWQNVFNLHFRHLNDLFVLKSWTLNFRFQFRSNFQQVGMSIISFLNLPDLCKEYYFQNKQNDLDPKVLYQLPHRKVMMGEDQDVVVSLKWISPWKAAFDPEIYEGWPTEGEDSSYDMGTLTLSVPFPMEISTGVDPTMTVRIWSWLSDLNYSGYNPEDTVI